MDQIVCPVHRHYPQRRAQAHGRRPGYEMDDIDVVFSAQWNETARTAHTVPCGNAQRDRFDEHSPRCGSQPERVGAVKDPQMNRLDARRPGMRCLLAMQ